MQWFHFNSSCRTAAAIVASVFALTGCAGTAQKFTALNPAALGAPLVITENQKQPCVAPELNAGDSKTRAVGNLLIELEDCETKRSALAQTIMDHNAQVEKRNSDEFARVNKTKP